MVMLTASHVSVFLSSAIVLFCTSALFLAGSAIQRRTLRDLRAAVRPGPDPSPRIILPDRFRSQTTELEDGTVVVLDPEPERDAPGTEMAAGAMALQGGGKGAVVIEIRPSLAGMGAGRARRGDAEGDAVVRDQPSPDPAGPVQHLVSRAERRRMIKEEIHRLAQDEHKVYYQRRLW